MLLRTALLLTAVACLIESSSDLWAQEAVSTTTMTTGSGATSSASATESSSNATNAPGATSGSGETVVETAPSGTGTFSRTPVQIYATISGGYDTNVNTSTNGQEQSSGFTNANAILDYTFGDPRLQLTLNTGAGGTYYYEHVSGQSYDIDFKGALGITYKSSPRLTIGSTILAEYLTEPSFEYAGGLNSRNGNYLYTVDKFFADYAWSRRFSTKTSYTFDAYNYDDDAVGLSSNRITNTFGNEFRLQLVPTTVLVAEYRYSIVSYEHEGEIVIPAVFIGPFQIAPAVRLQNDSTTHFAVAGIDHIFNPRLSCSLRGGAEFRSYNDDGDRSGPYFEGTVTYAIGRRTSLSWNSRYGLEEPDTPTEQSRTTFRTGLQAKIPLAPRIASTVDLYYVHDEFHALVNGPSVSTPFSENTFDGGITLRYNVTPLFGVQVGYHYSDVSSGMATQEYTRSRVFAGANVTF